MYTLTFCRLSFLSRVVPSSKSTHPQSAPLLEIKTSFSLSTRTGSLPYNTVRNVSRLPHHIAVLIVLDFLAPGESMPSKSNCKNFLIISQNLSTTGCSLSSPKPSITRTSGRANKDAANLIFITFSIYPSI